MCIKSKNTNAIIIRFLTKPACRQAEHDSLKVGDILKEEQQGNDNKKRINIKLTRF